MVSLEWGYSVVFFGNVLSGINAAFQIHRRHQILRPT